MPTEEASVIVEKPMEVEAPKPPTQPAAMAAGSKKRPRLDLSMSADGSRERKRGKSMFGIVLGTLNKAKIEDKERSASEAAKKRQLIEQRLQDKLRKETDSVRRAEEAKKDKTTANRKEEDLQLKDSIYKFRRARLPLYANFLLTSDNIPNDPDAVSMPEKPLSPPPRTHPPPLYYLPAILAPAQEAFLQRRKAEIREAVEKEWELFKEERTNGITEINQLRQRVADEEERRRQEKNAAKDDMDTDSVPAQLQPPVSENENENAPEPASAVAAEPPPPPTKAADMEVDDGGSRERRDEPKETAAPQSESEKKEEPASMQADDEDAVEY